MEQTNAEPTAERPRNSQESVLTEWAAARERLADARLYWLTTQRLDGRPHVVPCWAVWVDDALYTTASSSSTRGRHVANNPTCVVSISSPGLDLVVEGSITKVSDEAGLGRAAAAYEAKYGWPLTIRDGAFDAPYAAATAGPGPYELYQVKPSTVFGFPNDEPFTPTRWRF